ncbi:MAG TPA: heat-inducible transcriptional repressor HrcA [Thermotogota bacterium]|nr:heat-inducible transcriptional repressor HrcA [Thermotogota bacterium]HRW91440.1 heat-inducible transcriptional repressor HrcA [Thermotogota bacterium]
MSSLTDRQKKILYAVVHEFLQHKVPVSSKRILGITNLQCSSATVRNELQFLEEEGFIFQPHTSSGRIPSDTGLRFYVECLKEMGSSPGSAPADLELLPRLHFGSMEELLKNFSVFLSHLVRGLAVVERPFFDKLEIRKISITPILLNYWSVVIITNMGLAENFVFFMDQDFPAREMEEFLSEKLQGLPLEEVRKMYEKIQLPKQSWYNSGYDQLIVFLEKVVHQSMKKRFLKFGFENLVRDDSIPLDSLKRCLPILENESVLTTLMDDLQLEGSRTVNIGRELRRDELLDFSIFFHGYFAGDIPIGRIAVFTSKMTDYFGNLKNLEYVSNRLTEYMTRISHFSQ